MYKKYIKKMLTKENAVQVLVGVCIGWTVGSVIGTAYVLAMAHTGAEILGYKAYKMDCVSREVPEEEKWF